MLPAAIEVQTARNPFEGQRVHSYATEGETLETIILGQGLRLDGVYTVAVLINGELVPERWFPRVRPKAGTLVVLRVIPRGGGDGKGFLSILIGILAIAAAWFTGGASLSALGALGGAELATVAALAVSGITSIATGIQSLVAPPPAVPFGGSVPQSQDSAALTGTKNTARLYGPIRTVLGQYRVYPDLLGKPFAERVGKDSILRLLMCFGYGPLDITDIRIGETPIEELIPASKYVVHQGWDDDADLSIFRDEVDADGTLQPELLRTADPLTDRVTLTTKSGPEEISIDFQFAAGLIAFASDGNPRVVTVRFEVEEKESASATWTAIGDPTLGVDYDGATDTGFTKVSAGVFDLKLKERGLVTRGLRWTVPVGSTEGVTHDVRVSRVSTTTSVSNANSIFSDAKVSVIRTIKPHIAAQIPNLAKIELEINADETGLSSIIDNLSAICTSIAPKFDTVTGMWGPASAASAAYNASMYPTRNAAWLFAQVLRGPANSRPVDDSRLDGRGLADWAGNLDGSGAEPISGTDGVARNLDAVVDYSSTVRKVLADIAGAGRGALNLVDGKYSVVQDIPKDQVIQHFSPRNSRNFSGGKSFRKRPHAIRTHFVNPEPVEGGTKSYQKDELIVYDDGYTKDGDVLWTADFRGSLATTLGPSVPWVSSNGTATGVAGVSVIIEDTSPSINNKFRSPAASSTSVYEIDADSYEYIRCRMRRIAAGSGAWKGALYFKHDGETMDEARRIDIYEPDWSKGWVTLTWYAGDHANWTGTVDRIRFDFFEVSGTKWEIDKVWIDNGTQAATEFGELSLWGVADPEQAYRDGRYHIASSKLRPEVFAIEADVEHIVCTRGDLVRVTHDVIGVGYGGARFTSVSNAGGSFVSGELDEEFHYDSGKNYAIRIRGESSGSSGGPSDLLVNVVNQSGVSSTVQADPAFDYTGSLAPKAGDLILFGERGIESLECLVQRISPRNDLTAMIEMVEYNEAVYSPGTIPAHESNISLQTPPNLLTPVTPEFVGEPISDETAVSFSAAGSPEAQILVSVITPQNATGTYAPTTHYHAEFRAKTDNSETSEAITAWLSAPRVEAVGDTKIVIRPVDEGEVYDIRVRAISDVSATASGWIYKNNHTVIGLSTPPPDPEDLSVWGDAIRWEYPDKPVDFAGFVVKYQAGSDATWSTGIPITQNLITDNWVLIAGRIQPGVNTIMVRAIDLGGNESETLSAVRDILVPDALPIIRHRTWHGIFSLGTIVGATMDAGTGYLEANDNALIPFWNGGDAASMWATDGTTAMWGATSYKAMSYQEHYQIYDRYTGSWPTDDDLPGRIRFGELELEGSEIEIDYRPLFNFNPLTGEYFYGSWKPWPGHRDLDKIEFDTFSTEYETSDIRIRIAGGSVQGKIKKAKIVTEGLPRKSSSIETIASGGSVVSLVGQRWRKITNVTVTPANTANTPPGAVIGVAYDLNAEQTTTEPYELTGPTVRLYTSSGGDTSGTATVVIEGY